MLKKKYFSVLVSMVLLFTLGLMGCSDADSASTNSKGDVASFYEGEKIKFIVPYEPGGGYDEYSRMIAPYLEKYTGAKVEINNMPGAGGMRGVNELYGAPKDGLSIGIINGSAMVTNQVSGIKGADYKLGKFGYLGRIVADLRVLTMKKDGVYQSIEDMLEADKIIKIGATGLGGSTYVDAVITAKALGLDQEVIHGFDSSSVVEQAIMRGEVDGMWGSYGSRKSSLESGLAIPVLQSGKERSAELPDVPTYFELLEEHDVDPKAKEILTVLESLNSVGRPLAAPPGTPEDRLTFLQDAFDKAMNDPDFLAEVEKAERELSFATGDEMLEIAKSATEMPEDIKEIMLKAVKGEL